MKEKDLEIDAILKVATFIKATGEEVQDMRKACIELTLAIKKMNESLIEIKNNLKIDVSKMI
ncbi:MAG: hypothetical protein Q8936_14215 [Bacillota bacterium]|nr:hypothetical protein [Bacillota bacterium]